MSYPNLIIGGIEIPLRALTDVFSQEYEEIAAISARRMASGVLHLQRAWPASGNYKLRTTLQGGGRLPAPLDNLDRGGAHEIQCAQHRHAGAAGNVIVIPAGRRSGGIYAPQGFALVAGELVSTPLSIATNTATLTAVSGAQHYEVRYWPKFTGAITHKSSGEPWLARRTWSVTIEEV